MTFDDVFDQPGSIRSLAILRILLGPVVVIHFAPVLADSLRGVTYRDSFHTPWLSALAEVPGGVQVALVWTGAAAAVAMGLGWRTRLVAPITWLCVAGNFFLTQSNFRHNRAFLLYVLAAVALADSGRVLSVDARRRRNRTCTVAGAADDQATLWPLWTLRVLASGVYLGSGISKLVDPDWRSGLVLWDRAVRFQDLVGDAVPGALGEVAVDIATTRWVHTITSPLAIAMELIIGFGLWFGRSRVFAAWVAIIFHVSIELTASVEVFSLAALAALAIWVTPATRDRSVVTADATWIRRLDWLGRFDVTERPGAALSVTDRDGSVSTGVEARRLIRSRLPMTWFLVAPVRRWR